MLRVRWFVQDFLRSTQGAWCWVLNTGCWKQGFWCGDHNVEFSALCTWRRILNVMCLTQYVWQCAFNMGWSMLCDRRWALDAGHLTLGLLTLCAQCVGSQTECSSQLNTLDAGRLMLVAQHRVFGIRLLMRVSLQWVLDAVYPARCTQCETLDMWRSTLGAQCTALNADCLMRNNSTQDNLLNAKYLT